MNFWSALALKNLKTGPLFVTANWKTSKCPITSGVFWKKMENSHKYAVTFKIQS